MLYLDYHIMAAVKPVQMIPKAGNYRQTSSHGKLTRITMVPMLLTHLQLDTKACHAALLLTFIKYHHKYPQIHNATVDMYTNKGYLTAPPMPCYI